MKSFTLDGKRHKLNPAVPTQQIEFLVRNRHVGTSDADIRADIQQRASRINAEPAIINSMLDYAVYCHRNNQKLYVKVMRG